MSSLKKLHKKEENLTYDPQDFENIYNLVRTKLEFPSQEFNPNNQEHVKAVEKIYYEHTYQNMPTGDNTNTLTGDSDSRMTYFTDENNTMYINDPSHFMVKKEDEFGRISNLTQNSPYISKSFKHFQSPALKQEAKETSLLGKRSGCEQYYNNDLNDENINSLNFPKIEVYADNIFFESPYQKKKVKFNTIISPNMLDMDKHQPKITDRYG